MMRVLIIVFFFCFVIPVNASDSMQAKAHSWALAGNPQFYEKNWTLKGDAESRKCLKSFLRCFKNGYCASISETKRGLLNATAGYSLKGSNADGDEVILRRMDKMEVTNYSHPHPVHQFILPDHYSLPTLVTFLNLKMELHEGDEARTDGLVQEKYISDQTGKNISSQDASDLTFHACAYPFYTKADKRQCKDPLDGKHCNTPSGRRISEDAANNAKYYVESYEAFAKIAKQRLALQNRLDAIAHKFDALVGGSDLSRNQLLQIIHNGCNDCADFKKKSDFLTQSLKLAQNGSHRWRDIHHEATTYWQTHAKMLDGIDHFLNVKLQDHIDRYKELQHLKTEAELKAEVEAFHADPYKMLRNSYHNYMIVRTCHDARKSMFVQFINANDLRQAKNSIKAIEKALVKRGQSLDTDAIWQETQDKFGDLSITPYAIVAKPGSMMAALVDSVQAVFVGKTGAERRAYFQTQVRNPPSKTIDRDQIKNICTTAFESLAKEAARLATKTGNEMPKIKKDF